MEIEYPVWLEILTRLVASALFGYAVGSFLALLFFRRP